MPQLSERVTVLEEQIKPLQEFRTWGVAIIGGGILALATMGVMWGTTLERLETLRAEVQHLRQDLSGRAAR